FDNWIGLFGDPRNLVHLNVDGATTERAAKTLVRQVEAEQHHRQQQHRVAPRAPTVLVTMIVVAGGSRGVDVFVLVVVMVIVLVVVVVVVVVRMIVITPRAVFVIVRVIVIVFVVVCRRFADGKPHCNGADGHQAQQADAAGEHHPVQAAGQHQA